MVLLLLLRLWMTMHDILTLRDGIFQRVAIAPFDHMGNWILLEDFTYHIWFKWSPETITVPAGFIFNWMSIPRLFWWFAHPMESDTIIASLVHDHCFYTRKYSLSKSDWIFYDALIACQVNKYKAFVLYRGLRLWSWYVWYKNLHGHKKEI